QMGMANAMVIGLSPWLRYVVFTDRLIEDFSPEEVEAVLGHEIGHIRHRHMPTYLLFLSGSMVVLGLLADHYFLPAMASIADSMRQSIPWLPSWLPDQLGPGGDLGAVPIAMGMLLYIFGIFGYLSRGCERQADIFGCRAVSCSNPVCQSHEENTVLPDRGAHLCPTGIRTFIRALNKVAVINGISRDRPGFLQSWQHSTIERRVAFLERMLFNPRVDLQFQRGLLAIKVVLLGGLAIGLGILTHLHGWPW
ncbi:MAG: M48 family metallopeptidase, partial [Gemmataceae bacterium]